MTKNELRDLIRNCGESELPEIKRIARKEGFSELSIANFIRYRNPVQRNATKAQLNEYYKTHPMKDRYKDNPELRKRISDSVKAYHESHPEVMMGNTNGHGNKGRVFSEDSRRKMSESKKGVPNYKRRGKKMSEESRMKMSVAASRRTHRSRGWLFKYDLGDKVIILESSYELGALQTLRSRGLQVDRCDILIPHGDGNYIPDLKYMLNGMTHLVEVKPEKLILDPCTQAKYHSALKYIEGKSIVFEFFSENDLKSGYPDFKDPNILYFMRPGRMSRKESWIDRTTFLDQEGY